MIRDPARLLANLRGIGVVFTITPDGRLGYEARGRPLEQAQLDALREARNEVLALVLREDSVVPPEDELFRGRSKYLAVDEVSALVDRGWQQPSSLEWCVACERPVLLLDPAGRPRHTWCSPPERGAP